MIAQIESTAPTAPRDRRRPVKLHGGLITLWRGDSTKIAPRLHADFDTLLADPTGALTDILKLHVVSGAVEAAQAKA